MATYYSFGEAGIGYGKTLSAIGDSITSGTGASSALHRYTNVVSIPTSFTIENKAIAGTYLAQHLPQQICPIVVTDNSHSLILPGFNDVTKGYNTGHFAEYQENYYRTLLAALVWLGVTDKISGGDIRITENGSWTQTLMYSDSFTKLSTVTNGDTLTLSVTGTAIYIAYMRWSVASGKGGTFTIHVDGNLVATIDTTSNIAGFNAPTDTSWLNVARIDGLSAGEHSVVITALSAANQIDIAWISSNYRSDPQVGPTVWAGNTIHRKVVDYVPYGGDSSWTDVLNEYTAQAVSELHTDGLLVNQVDANRHYFPDNGDQGDSNHPNDVGHCHIAEAFLEAMA